WLIENDASCPVCGKQGGGSAAGAALHLRGSAGRSRTGRSYNGITGAFHRISVGERKIGKIAEAGEPMLIREVTGEESWVADREWMGREGIRSFAGQPLEFKGATLGVLAVFSRSGFSEEEFGW